MPHPEFRFDFESDDVAGWKQETRSHVPPSILPSWEHDMKEAELDYNLRCSEQRGTSSLFCRSTLWRELYIGK